MPAVVRLCEEFANSRRAAEDDDIKVEGSTNPQFRSAHTAPTESHSRSSAGRLERSLMAPMTSSAWSGRFMPSADETLFDSSFDQYYSSCKERGVIPVCILVFYLTVVCQICPLPVGLASISF